MAQLDAKEALFVKAITSAARTEPEEAAPKELSADPPDASGDTITPETIGDTTASSAIDRQMWQLEMQALREELDIERRARTALERRLAREIALTEKRIKGHLCYRLGREIVACRHSPLAWVVLPRQLLRAYSGFRQDAREKAELRVKPASPALLKLYSTEGAEGVVEQLRRAEGALTPAGLARELIRAGQRLAQGGVEGAELVLTAEAVKLDSSPATLRARFWACHRAADFTAAQEVSEQLWQVAQEQDLSAEEQIALDRIFRHPVRQLSILNLIRQPSSPLLEPVSGRLCYLLHNSLPYSSGGYATRSHGLASALAGSGWEVVAVTRPGFPFDVTSGLTKAQVGAKDEIDGVTYIRCFEPARRGLAPPQYIELAAAVVENELRRLRPQVVVAASNYLTALPTLIATRRLGLPFFYEVRGLWEITRVSREPEFARHINFWIQKSLEAAVARHADGVFTLTEAMREELASRGVPRARITLLPNCCNVAQFSPRGRDRALQAELAIPDAVPVIGYVGTFVGYEGLDDLAHACGLLKRRGATFRLLLVGNEDASGSLRGEITRAVEECAAHEGFRDWLIMPGRVPHEAVTRYYSLIDITPFPRKPLPVCEMVSPIKPLEALAMEKAVVVSDVRALAEMIRDGETGLLFRKGNVRDLADKLEILLSDPAARARLGRNGRQWVQEERAWPIIARRLSERLSDTVAGA